MTFANQDLQWLDNPLLAVDNGFKLSIGYAPDPLEKVFVGEITGVEPSFPNGGMPTIRVTAHDFLQRLTHGKVDRAFAIKLPTIGTIPLPDPVVAAIVSGTQSAYPRPRPDRRSAFDAHEPGQLTSLRRRSRRNRCARSQASLTSISSPASPRTTAGRCTSTTPQDPQGYMLRFQFLMQDYSPSVTSAMGHSR